MFIVDNRYVYLCRDSFQLFNECVYGLRQFIIIDNFYFFCGVFINKV